MEKNFFHFGRSASVASLALQGAEKVICQEPVILVGPLKVLKPIVARTPPGVGVAQREAVRRWYEQVEEGAPRVLQIQELPGSLPGPGASVLV